MALAAPASFAKPITIDLDAEVAKAKYVLEAALVEHVADRSASRLQVDLDPSRICRGFEAAGSAIEVRWPEYGGEQFRTGVVPGRRGLFVIRRDDSVAVVGFPAGDAYVVTGFCDHNAALIRIDGREQDFDEMQGPSVPVDWFAAKTGWDPRRDALLLGRILLESIPDGEARSRFEEATRDLDADDWSVRDRAERALTGPLGLAFRDELAARARSTTSLEESHRLERIAAGLGRWVRASETAATLRAPGEARWRVFVACLRLGDPGLSAEAHTALVAETGRELPLDAAAWEEALLHVESAR